MGIIVIPAFEPDRNLVELVKNINYNTNYKIIVVNDGSSSEYNTIFEQVTEYAMLRTHPCNKGKGAAMKTALSFIKRNIPEESEIVFVDADGQHDLPDAINVMEAVKLSKDSLILGSRTFTGEIPWKSRYGNLLTRKVFHLISGCKVMDTQTGLRGMHSNLIDQMLSIRGDRYEYEMNMLMYCARNAIPIKEIPIQTIYLDEQNTSSHFHPVRDSIRIYGNILLFAGISMLSFVIDYFAFLLFYAILLGLNISNALIISNVGARIFSAAINYYLNKTLVFDVNKKELTSLVRYAVLASGILIMNSVILLVLCDIFTIPSSIAKIITELILFVLSFIVQNRYVYQTKSTSMKKEMKSYGR